MNYRTIGMLSTTALAALSIFGATSASAEESSGTPFCTKQIANSTDLEERFNRSLAADSKGYRPLEGCVGRPIDFLVSFQADDPEAHLKTVADLPGYAHDMTATRAKANYQYESSCLWSQAGGGHFVKLGCVTRDVRKGEVIFASRTGKLVLMSSCANPGVIEVPPIVVTAQGCKKFVFPAYDGRETRVAFIGRKALPGVCVKLQVAGVSEPYIDNMPQECKDSYTKEVADEQGRKRVYNVSCTWKAVEHRASELLGYRATVQNLTATFIGKANGTNVLWLPEEALDGQIVVCYDDDDRSYGARRDSYVNGVATVPPEMVAHR